MPETISKAALAAEAHPENWRARMGGNAPPPQETFKELNDSLPAYLESTYEATFKRADDLAEAFGRMPETIDSEELAGRVSDFAAQITALVKQAESFRTDLIAGPLAAQRLINTTFDKRVFAALDPDNKKTPGIKQKVLAMLTVWERKKADMERARRAEEERKAAEAAAAAERARVEAERKAREAQEAEQRRIEEDARRVAAAQEAERQRVAEEARKAHEAAAAAAKAIQDEKDLEKAIEMEAQEKVARAAREREAAIAREKAEAQAKAEAAKREQEAAEARSRADAEAKAAQEASDRAAADAAKARDAAEAKAANLHTVRGDLGSSSSLRSSWKGYVVDEAEMLKAAPDLWPFFPLDVKEKALNAFVKINKGSKQLPGCEIRLDTGAVVRG